MELVNILTTADKKRIHAAVSKCLEQYRIVKSVLALESESAFYSSEQHEKFIKKCKRVEAAVNELPDQEKFLITERYLQPDSDYISDSNVYKERFNPSISPVAYTKYRNRAIVKLAFLLGVESM
ncbi:hypothetical protein [Neobacillus sp.]|uniref:hypothetical protein n=1 Tax=Neobacillus sp. TaxID=2675273 RepID=UPI00289B372F|nr:hypothetical protein [Neobacillus sp.]